MILIGLLLLTVGILLLLFGIGMIAGVMCSDAPPTWIGYVSLVISVVLIIVGLVMTGTDILTWLGVL